MFDTDSTHMRLVPGLHSLSNAQSADMAFRSRVKRAGRKTTTLIAYLEVWL
jgi:hypothetical protein